jgi:hypothetical protein
MSHNLVNKFGLHPPSSIQPNKKKLGRPIHPSKHLGQMTLFTKIWATTSYPTSPFNQTHPLGDPASQPELGTFKLNESRADGSGIVHSWVERVRALWPKRAADPPSQAGRWSTGIGSRRESNNDPPNVRPITC